MINSWSEQKWQLWPKNVITQILQTLYYLIFTLAEERTTEDDRKLIMEARQKAAEKMKKLSIKSKQDSVETNSMEEGGKPA